MAGQINNDVSVLYLYRAIWTRMAQIIDSHLTIPRTPALGMIATNYATSQAVAVRLRSRSLVVYALGSGGGRSGAVNGRPIERSEPTRGHRRSRAMVLGAAAVVGLGGVTAATMFLLTHPNTSTLAGMTWSQASLPQTSGLDHPLRAVIGTGAGFLAGGKDDTDPLLWTSADGRSWEPLRGGPSVGEVDAFASFGGRIYAAGSHGTTIDAAPTVWSSADERHWSALTLPDGRGAVRALAAGPGGLVAAGSEPGGSSYLWRSPDGVQWQLVDLKAGGVLPGERLAFTSLVATTNGYVALAVATSALPATPLALLTSSDGTHWSRVAGADMPGAGAQTATVVQQQGPAAGNVSVALQPAPASITALAVDGERVLALTINTDLRWRPRDNAIINHIAPAVWASADGRSWSWVDEPLPYGPGEWTHQES